MEKSEKKLLQSIHEKVIRIETHLSDINGKVNRNETFLRVECPRHISNFQEFAAKVSVYMKIISFIGGALFISIVTDIILRTYLR